MVSALFVSDTVHMLIVYNIKQNLNFSMYQYKETLVLCESAEAPRRGH